MSPFLDYWYLLVPVWLGATVLGYFGGRWSRPRGGWGKALFWFLGGVLVTALAALVVVGVMEALRPVGEVPANAPQPNPLLLIALAIGQAVEQMLVLFYGIGGTVLGWTIAMLVAWRRRAG